MYLLGKKTGKKKVYVGYMSAPLPYAIEENYGGCFFDDDDDLAQVLQDQVGYCFLCSSLIGWAMGHVFPICALLILWED